jgi:hypothetical protein
VTAPVGVAVQPSGTRRPRAHVGHDRRGLIGEPNLNRKIGPDGRVGARRDRFKSSTRWRGGRRTHCAIEKVGLGRGDGHTGTDEQEDLGPRLRGQASAAVKPLAAITRGRDRADVRVGAGGGRGEAVRGKGHHSRAFRIARVVVELGRGEGLKELAGDLVAAVGGIARLLEGDGGGAGRHLMLAVSSGAGPHGEDHFGPPQAHASHNIAEPGFAPVFLDLLGGEGEIEILQADELRRVDPHHGQRSTFLLLADEAKGGARLAPDGVAAAFTAGEGNDRAPVSLVEQVAGEGGHDPGVVIGVGADEHDVDVHEVETGPRSPTGL